MSGRSTRSKGWRRALVALVTLSASGLATVITASPAVACENDECGAATIATFVSPGAPNLLYGTPLALSANVWDNSHSCVVGFLGCDYPTGSVEFYDVAAGPAPGQFAGSAPLTRTDPKSSTTAVDTIYSGLSVGTDRTILGRYAPSGANSFDPADDTYYQHFTVGQREPGISFSTTASSVVGQTVHLRADLAAPAGVDLSHGAHRPTGMVEWLDCAPPSCVGFGTSIASSNLLLNIDPPTATATLDWNLLDAGVHYLTARYLTDGDYSTKESATITHTVLKGDVTNTLAQTAGNNPTVFGESFTLTDTVAAASPASGTPTGLITFKDNGTAVGSPVSLSGGTAALPLATLSAGSHALTASYPGDVNFNALDSNVVNHIVNKADTTTALVSPTTNPSNAFDPVTLNATIAVTAPGAGSPTGSVQFKDGAALIGVPVAVTAGAASLVTTTLGGGAHSITAVYSGDTNFNGSTSGPLSRSVNCGTTKTGTVSGTYTAPSSGTTCLTSATITGGLTVPAGARVLISNSSVAGPLVANGGAGSITICGSSLSTVRINGANGLVTLGDPYGANGCAGNTIGGSVTLSSNTAGVRFNANHTNSLVQVTGNSGGATIIGGNTIAGSFTCSGNNPVAANGGHPNSSASRSGECASPTF
jgi:hypothetical protein